MSCWGWWHSCGVTVIIINITPADDLTIASRDHHQALCPMESKPLSSSRIRSGNWIDRGIWLSNGTLIFFYNTPNFLQITQIYTSSVRVRYDTMGCLFWVQELTDCLTWLLSGFTQYRVILDRVIKKIGSDINYIISYFLFKSAKRVSHFLNAFHCINIRNTTC